MNERELIYRAFSAPDVLGDADRAKAAALVLARQVWPEGEEPAVAYFAALCAIEALAKVLDNGEINGHLLTRIDDRYLADRNAPHGAGPQRALQNRAFEIAQSLEPDAFDAFDHVEEINEATSKALTVLCNYILEHPITVPGEEFGPTPVL